MRLGGQKLADQIADLVGLRRAEIVLLESLSKQTDALVAGPFNTGMRYLEDATADWRSVDQRHELLTQARSSFTQALGQDLDHLRRSHAALHLAVVWMMSNSPDDAKLRLQEAHHEAVLAGRELSYRASRMERITAGPSRWLKAVGDFAAEWGPTGRPPAIVYDRDGNIILSIWEKRWLAKARPRTQKNFGDIEPYTNAIAAMRLVLGEPKEAVPMYWANVNEFRVVRGKDFPSS